MRVLASVQFSHMYGIERDQCEAGAAATHPRISCSMAGPLTSLSCACFRNALYYLRVGWAVIYRSRRMEVAEQVGGGALLADVPHMIVAQ